MAKRYPFEIQVVNRAFSGKVPESLWQTIGRASHPITALRRVRREQKAVTPQPGSWSGHVRVLCNGEPVWIEDYGNIVMSPITYKHIDWQAEGNRGDATEA